jgi:hypothetical protein
LKKLAAIFIIALLFFNWYGYRIVTTILVNGADKQLELRLDNNEYDESQLIEIKVPLNIPYQSTQADFERCYGEIEIAGKYYTYVKRKVGNGYLILKCIPNNSKEQIKAAGNDYFKMTNGLGQPDKKQDKSNVAKNFSGDFDGRENDFTLTISVELIDKDFLNNTPFLYTTCLAAPGQPPEMACS